MNCSTRRRFSADVSVLARNTERATASPAPASPWRMSNFDSPMNPLAGIAGLTAVNSVALRCFTISAPM
jgi:hypothetical protein